jgi:hypothetical protein
MTNKMMNLAVALVLIIIVAMAVGLILWPAEAACEPGEQCWPASTQACYSLYALCPGTPTPNFYPPPGATIEPYPPPAHTDITLDPEIYIPLLSED